MNEVITESLGDFENKIRNVLNQWKIEHDYKAHSPAEVLYRGQPSGEYKLETSLERSSKVVSMREYFHTCLVINPSVESEVDKTFKDVTHEKIEEWCKNINRAFLTDLLWYDYLTFLRHHGFPSPILDWTHSQNIALAFAFFDERPGIEEKPDSEQYRAVFCYLETPEGGKGSSRGEPEIRLIGQYLKSDKRHFLQQSNYTLCYKQVENDLEICKYSEVREEFGGSHQDVIYKFLIPEKERIKILRNLFSMNITPYSLMPSKENLMKSLWIKEYILRKNHTNKFRDRKIR